MDYLNLISNAQVIDQDGDNVGEVMGFSVTGNRMTIKMVVQEGYDFTDDDGGGEEVPTSETQSQTTEAAPLPDLRLVNREGSNG